MANDDPLDASKDLIAAEQRADSPLWRFLPYVAELTDWLLPSNTLGEPSALDVLKFGLKGAGAWISKIEADRREYLMDVLREEVKRIRAKQEGLDEHYVRLAPDKFVPLMLDGLQKAEQTLSKERIRRIAAILAHAWEVGASREVDVAEEMMRIAMATSEDDVVVLRALYDGQKDFYNPARGRVNHEEANEFWRLLDPQNRSFGHPVNKDLQTMSSGALEGICAKLQSFGLLAQVERNKSKVSPGITPYAVLAKTIDFVEYVRGSA